MSFALPFLAIRILYSTLGAFLKAPSKFSPLTGNWGIYLIMGLLMEYAVVWLYIYGGITTTPEETKGPEYELGEESNFNIRGQIAGVRGQLGGLRDARKNWRQGHAV